MKSITNKLNNFRSRVRKYLNLSDDQYKQLLEVSNRFKDLPNSEELYSEVFKQPKSWNSLEDLISAVEDAIKSHSNDPSRYKDIQKIEMGSINDMKAEPANTYQRYDKGRVFSMRLDRSIYDRFNSIVKEYHIKSNDLVNVFMEVFSNNNVKRNVLLDLLYKDDRYLKLLIKQDYLDYLDGK
jgi:hypothetical protein